jgi:hypothetical protein
LQCRQKNIYHIRFTSEDSMKKAFSRFGLHLLVFIIIEVIFVLILFRELPETNLITLIGILHTSYWLILLFAWWLREKMHNVRQKALCSYLPVLYHVFIHLYAWRAALEMHHDSDGHAHDEHELGWMIAGALLLWILIFVGEYLLHRKLHCDSHHISAHKHCHDGDCEKEH